MLLEEMLGVRVPIRCRIDNSQAITAINKGYSKKLRYLQRCHRVALGALHELVTDPEMKITIEYVESKLQKGDIFTKAMSPASFTSARETIGMMEKLDNAINGKCGA